MKTTSNELLSFEAENKSVAARSPITETILIPQTDFKIRTLSQGVVGILLEVIIFALNCYKIYFNFILGNTCISYFLVKLV